MAVGLILEPQQAEAILQAGEADLIALAREMLANPNFAAQAALALEGAAGWDLWSDQFATGWNAAPRRSSAKGGRKFLIPSDPLKLNFVARIPGAAQHKVMRCRTGIVSNAKFLTIPDQRHIAVALHRAREKRQKPCFKPQRARGRR